ncbi:MFS transporter [Teredinibacter turnerae]|nr:MFS transporter [Teredinibacter turnerae]
MDKRDLFTLLILVAMSFFLMCDVFITPAILPVLTREYSVTSVQLSWVGSAFILVGAVISLFFGYYTDKGSRKNLLLITVVVGEIPCLLTGVPYFTDSFTGYLVLRILTGIGVGGIYPLMFSLIGDYFSEKHRATACAGVDLAWGLGMIAGPIFASIALSTEYGWRLAFILAAIPNFPLAILFYYVAREPRRGQSESLLKTAKLDVGEEYNYTIKSSDIRKIFANKTNVLIFLQGIPGSIPWGLFPFWLILIFTDSGKLTQTGATVVWELFGITAGVGGFAWALVGDRMFLRKPSYLPLLCATGIFIGIVPMLLLFNLNMVGMTGFLILACLSGSAISVASSNSKAILMNVNRPEHRGSVFALYNLGDNLGKGIGPAVGGVLYTLTGSYTQMANSAIMLWILAGVIYLVVISTINADRTRLLNLMKDRGGL